MSAESRQNLHGVEAKRRKNGDTRVTRPSHERMAGAGEGRTTLVSRSSGAVLRAVAVAAVVAAPSLLLPVISGDTKQLVALAALFAAALVFAEYRAAYPTLVEFRDAPPFNRIRFLLLGSIVLGLTLIERGNSAPNSLTEFVHAAGRLIGLAMDFPYSPVRLVTLVLADGTHAGQVAMVRDAAGLAYFASLVWLAVFVVALRLGAWPQRGRSFNVWTNLPTFDPTAGGDVVARLERDGRVNIALGVLLPFVIPFFVSLFSEGVNPISLASPQTLIWTMTLWAFLPASLFMRGIAMCRIAEMIRDIRRAQTSPEAAQGLATA